MRIVGLDLSLTATGVCIFNDWGDTSVYTIKTKPAPGLNQTLERLHTIARQIIEETTDADLVVIEGPSYGSNTPSTWDRAGLWWMVINSIIAANSETDIAVVPPTVLKKSITGKGNADKETMLLSVVRKLPNLDIRNNNEADAAGLMLIGTYLKHAPLVELPKPQVDTIMKLQQ